MALFTHFSASGEMGAELWYSVGGERKDDCSDRAEEVKCGMFAWGCVGDIEVTWSVEGVVTGPEPLSEWATNGVGCGAMLLSRGLETCCLCEA